MEVFAGREREGSELRAALGGGCRLVLRRGRALAESAGDGEACLLTDVYESDALVKTAKAAAAAEVAMRGLASARQAGLEEFWTTAILAANGAEALLHQGRTADAAALIGPGMVFCLSTGPSKEAVRRVHEKAGHPADQVYELPVEV